MYVALPYCNNEGEHVAISMRLTISLAFGIAMGFCLVAATTAYVQIPSLQFWLTALLPWQTQ